MPEQKTITQKKQAVGILIIARNTGRVFLLQRSSSAGHSHLWALLSGGMEPGEDPLQTIAREVREEISINPSIIDFHLIKKEITPRNDFYYYVGFTNSEFRPTLDFENEDWGWFDPDELPSPTFPGLKEKIKSITS
jgi:8-oxo-dGTP pyrophosphatase MutT (NUDIX family)